ACTVRSQGQEYRISVKVDLIAQEPRIEHVVSPAVVKNGTRVRLEWPGAASYIRRDEGEGFYNAVELISAYVLFNPHAELRLNGSRMRTPTSWPHWRGCDRTCSHWYTPGQLATLVAAYVHLGRQAGAPSQSVREFVTNFHKLTGSIKPRQVLQ